MSEQVLRLAGRASRLARVQTELVASQIRTYNPALQVEVLGFTTAGDCNMSVHLDQLGGKGLFLQELEEKLAEGQVDLCVHSLKDVPLSLPKDLPLGAYLKRASPWDVLVLPVGQTTLDTHLPVGCASARRRAQLCISHPEWTVEPVRGNVQTRLKKLDSGAFGGLILAEAGLDRLGLTERITYRFTLEEMVPAPGQGIIAIQGRRGEYADVLQAINDPETAVCAQAERHVAEILGGDCAMPFGCYAEIHAGIFTITGFCATASTSVHRAISGTPQEALSCAEALAAQLQDVLPRIS